MKKHNPSQDEAKRLKKTHYKQNETVSFTWLGEFLIGTIEKITKTNTEVIYSIREESTGIRYPCRLTFGQVNRNSPGKIGLNANAVRTTSKRHHVEDNDTTSNVSISVESASTDQSRNVDSKPNRTKSSSTRTTKVRSKDTTRPQQDSSSPLSKFFSI